MQVYIQSMPSYAKSRWQIALGSGRWRSFKLTQSAIKHVEGLIAQGHTINEQAAWNNLKQAGE
jgi:hypothetical protein